MASERNRSHPDGQEQRSGVSLEAEVDGVAQVGERGRFESLGGLRGSREARLAPAATKT